MKKRVFISLLAAAAVACTLPAATWAQEETRIIRFIVPYAPGGLPDTVARIIGHRLQQATGRAVIVDNRPGGNGALAAAALATASADGANLLITDGSMITISPLIMRHLPYDADADFVPVSLIAASPLFLAVHSGVKAHTLQEFIDLVKDHPESMSYGSSGVGSSHHLAMEVLKAGFGLSLLHVPYKGSGASVPALVGGQVDAVFSAYPSLAGFAKSGKVRILATNSARRSSLAPDVPAISEALPGYDFAVRVIAVAHAGMPRPLIRSLSADIAEALRDPEVIDDLKHAGIEPIGGSPEQLRDALKLERARMADAVRRLRLQTQ